MIREPPALPVAILSTPVSRSSEIELAILLCGRFPGSMKLIGEGAKPKELTDPGLLKSSISSFSMIPEGVISRAPQIRFTVVVRLTAIPSPSTTAICDVPDSRVAVYLVGS